MISELFPSGGNNGTPDQETMDYFFVKEQLPPNWYSRVQPYTILEIAVQIFAMYQLHPVQFGGNTGSPNSFAGVGENGLSLESVNGTDPKGVACLLYQVATEDVPASLRGGGDGPVASNNTYKWAANQLNPLFGVGQALSSLVGLCQLNYNSQ
jgi:unspecific peroxygenase